MTEEEAEKYMEKDPSCCLTGDVMICDDMRTSAEGTAKQLLKEKDITGGLLQMLHHQEAVFYILERRILDQKAATKQIVIGISIGVAVGMTITSLIFKAAEKFIF